jgi:hypothetical protein
LGTFLASKLVLKSGPGTKRKPAVSALPSLKAAWFFWVSRLELFWDGPKVMICNFLPMPS